MTIPDEVRMNIKTQLWEAAEALDWDSLTAKEKAQHYSQWTDSEIGRTLATHMDARAVRVYIKDSLLKGFSRQKLNEHEGLILRILGRDKSDVASACIKPHGLYFGDGSLVTWGRADDWKTILGSTFERAYGRQDARPVVVLFRAAPRYVRQSSRELVEEAARRLGVVRCVWFD
jgi:hypothetical protein